MTLRRVATGVAAVLLLALAAWCLTRGVQIRPTTGGLLTEPVPQTRLYGGWLLGATAAVTAAVLTGWEALSPARSPARRAGVGAPGTLDA